MKESESITANRRSSAFQSFKKASRWASIVMGLALPILLFEVCVSPIAVPTEQRLNGAVLTIFFCLGCWGLWVGSATFVGWLSNSSVR